MPRSLPKPKVSTAVSNPFAEGFSSAALAHSIVAAVVHEAQKRSVRVCVAVVDSGGHLLAFLRMDGLPFHLISIAQDKAVTVYTAHKSSIVDTLIPIFEQETGLKAEVVKLGSGDIAKRAKAEAANPAADVIWSISDERRCRWRPAA